ncbi:MAG: UDP-N-acetylmuramoyl-tripeptide--D-alanyl-D-alanine ligase [Akkermansiaceae bacterium]
MKHYPLQILASAMNGTLLNVQDEGETVVTSGVSTDTRSIAEGSLFFALRGENFDAHNFLDQAGSAAALVVQDENKVPSERAAILVDSTLTALQMLARWYLAELNIPVIAITGSNGKTSTKDFVRSVISQKFRAHATLGNFNNHIGLPLTVLALEPEHEVAILEMGMNHSGELAPLCEIAPPAVSIITNIGSAHIEHMGSIEAIAEEKGTVARALKPEGTLVIPSDCAHQPQTTGRTLFVGDGPVRAENIVTDTEGSRFDLVIDDLGRIATSIPVTGKHMVSNALLAAGAGFTMGLSLEEISKGLAETTLTSGRLRQYDHAGIAVIDDTYNANPESVIAALETLAALPGEGKKTAVLGMMAELGDHAEAAYERVGQLAAAKNLSLVVVGEPAETIATAARNAGGAVDFFPNVDAAASFLKTYSASGDLVLFKGSRAAAMERVMQTAFPQN